MRKTFTPGQKALIAIEALKGDKTISQISSIHKIHPNQVSQWRNTVKENINTLFTDKRKKENKEQEELINELYRIIGQRDIELEWIKKKLQI